MSVKLLPVTAPIGSPEIRVTPEELAAISARFSRNKEGLDDIIEVTKRVKDPNEIFNFIDYGHTSIQELSGTIPLVFENEGMIVIYTIMRLMDVYSGQESSTRFIPFDGDIKYMTPESIGLHGDEDEEAKEQYHKTMKIAIETYKVSCQEISQEFGRGIEGSIKDKDIKRCKKLVCDSIRHLLPMTVETSAVIMANPQEWSKVIKKLRSLDINVFNFISDEIESVLKKIVPNLIRHTEPDFISRKTMQSMLTQEATIILNRNPNVDNIDMSVDLMGFDRNEDSSQLAKICEGVFKESEIGHQKLKDALTVASNKGFTDLIKDATEFREHRYDVLDPVLDTIPVKYSFKGVPMSDIRDVNRHRPGGKNIIHTMDGLFFSEFILKKESLRIRIERLKKHYKKLMVMLACKKLHWFGMLLGTQNTIERSNSLRKAIYECELRTGKGTDNTAYSSLYKSLASLIKKTYNANILVGSSEPNVNKGKKQE